MKISIAALLLLSLIALACSPFGGRSASDGLVFVRRAGSDTDLFRARISDGALRRMWETPKREEMWPYWSEAAGKLIFEVRPYLKSERPESARDDDPDQRLLVFDPSSGTESLLSKAPALLEHWANWSPLGDHVAFAFSSHLGVAPTAGIAFTEVASGQRSIAASALPDSRLFRPRFSPDGRSIVAQRWSNLRASSKLWLFEMGAAPRALTKGQKGVDGKPRFTRDGALVVFTRRPVPRAEGDIWIIGTDGSGASQIVSAADADDHAADPSPTRDEVAFVSNRSGNYDIWLADLAGGTPRNLTNSPEFDEGAVRWSPDGERLVMSRTPVGVDPDLRPGQRPKPRFVVLSRDGRVLFATEGFSPDWMPPWR